jgi:NAD+-dependent protein deacetylase SIR2
MGMVMRKKGNGKGNGKGKRKYLLDGETVPKGKGKSAAVSEAGTMAEVGAEAEVTVNVNVKTENGPLDVQDRDSTVNNSCREDKNGTIVSAHGNDPARKRLHLRKRCLAGMEKACSSGYEEGEGEEGEGEEGDKEDEALSIRYRARAIGVEAFFAETLLQDPSRIYLSRLCEVFGVSWNSPTDPLPLPLPLSASLLQPPPPVATKMNSQVLARLKRAIATDVGRRIRLREHSTVNDAVWLLRAARNVLVITGAGVSTALGVPDFRSPDGLYARLRDMGFSDPEEVFSRDSFEQDPRPFFAVAAMILPPQPSSSSPPGEARFTPAHAFLRLLQDRGSLLTVYTQNIDGVDGAAGIRKGKLVQLHGSFETATCTACGHCVRGDDIFPAIRKNDGQVPECPDCVRESQARVKRMAAMRAQSGRSVRQRTQRGSLLVDRSSRQPDGIGIMRPDIVFMDEPPRPYLKRFERDCARVDLVIVMGTSLPVEPVSSMPNRIPAHVPQIYIGKNPMGSEQNRRIDFDIQLLGECDVVVDMLAKRCGWDLRHDIIPEEVGFAIEPWAEMRHCHSVRRETAAAAATTAAKRQESNG